MLLCQLIQLCHHCLRERLHFYREGTGGYDTYIKMESLLVSALAEMLGGKPLSPTAADAVVAFLDLMRSRGGGGAGPA